MHPSSRSRRSSILRPACTAGVVVFESSVVQEDATCDTLVNESTSSATRITGPEVTRYYRYEFCLNLNVIFGG